MTCYKVCGKIVVMKIEYFEFGNYGYGTIFRYVIDTEDKNYISHTEDSVTFTDSFTDEYDDTQYHNVTRTRKFSEIRDELIASHKKNILERQKEVDILESSDSFEIYDVNNTNARKK